MEQQKISQQVRLQYVLLLLCLLRLTISMFSEKEILSTNSLYLVYLYIPTRMQWFTTSNVVQDWLSGMIQWNKNKMWDEIVILCPLLSNLHTHDGSGFSFQTKIREEWEAKQAEEKAEQELKDKEAEILREQQVKTITALITVMFYGFVYRRSITLYHILAHPDTMTSIDLKCGYCTPETISYCYYTLIMLIKIIVILR